MLSPTRSSTQTIIKAVVTTTSGVLQEGASTSVEHQEAPHEIDDVEPLQKKFKADNEIEVTID